MDGKHRKRKWKGGIITKRWVLRGACSQIVSGEQLDNSLADGKIQRQLSAG